MAHEELKKQFEKDRKIHGDDVFRLWEYQDYGFYVWEPCFQEPSWHPFNKYRRKEPSFVPEYFSGLNWREAERLIGKMVEFSDEPDMEGWEKGVLVDIRYDSGGRFGDQSCYFEYIRTTPETHAHPTINLGGVELPRPEVEAPAIGTRCWVFDPTENEVDTFIWSRRDRFMTACLEQGTLHLTEARAQAWADWWENIVMAAVKGGA